MMDWLKVALVALLVITRGKGQLNDREFSVSLANSPETFIWERFQTSDLSFAMTIGFEPRPKHLW